MLQPEVEVSRQPQVLGAVVTVGLVVGMALAFLGNE